MYEYDFPLYAPDTDPRIAKTPLYARAFDRFSQGDPNSPYKMDDDHKKRAFR